MKKLYFLLLAFSSAIGFSQNASNGQISNPQIDGIQKTYNLCSYEQEGNSLQDGIQSNTAYVNVQADDFTVPAGECWNVGQVMASYFTSEISDISGIEVTFYNDNAGTPGTIYASEIVPLAAIDINYVGSNYGFDVHHHTMTLSNAVELCGAPGGTNYWVSFQVINTFSSFYWECTYLSTYGANSYEASSEAGPWSSSAYDFVYELIRADVVDLTVSVCDGASVTVGPDTYSSTGTYQNILTNMSGCDSIVNLDLTIDIPATGTDIISSCEPYAWIDGNTYTTSNNTATYMLIGGSVNGCDSTVMLDLTINPLDVSVTQTGVLLEANEAGATYQWLDCNNGLNAVSTGGTGQTYTNSSNGSFAVEVTNNGCTDTSTCFMIDYSGMDEYTLDGISVYPNPVNESVNILGLNKLSGVYQINVSTSTGAVIVNHATLTSTIDFADLASGIYFVNIYHQDGIVTLRVLKN